MTINLQSDSVLVSGVGGFTGLYFTKLLGELDINCISLKSNLTDLASLTEEINSIKPTYALHLAAISSVTHSTSSEFYSVNTIGTDNFLRALSSLSTKPKNIVVVSSANVYGNTDNVPCYEQDPTSPVNHYAISKLAAEYATKRYFDRLPIVIARPFNYTGVNQSANFLIPKILARFHANERSISLGNIAVQREFNDVRWVVSVYLLLLLHGKPTETYNIASGVSYSISYIIEVFQELFGHVIQITQDPALMRPNELVNLTGSPLKLNSLVESYSYSLPPNNLYDLLRWMSSSLLPL